jgi:hypothetical protein
VTADTPFAAGDAWMRATTKRDQINKPVTEPESIWSVYLVTDSCGRGQNVLLGDDEVAQYNADPDGFAARYFGLADVAEYREWVACDGAPLCSERTKSGKPCSGRVGKNHGVAYWRQHHRTAPCRTHGGDAPPQPPTREPRDRRHPASDDRRCEAMVKAPDSWNGCAWQWGPHQCGKPGTHIRDGRRVCNVHRDCAVVAFVARGRP